LNILFTLLDPKLSLMVSQSIRADGGEQSYFRPVEQIVSQKSRGSQSPVRFFAKMNEGFESFRYGFESLKVLKVVLLN
jgi:hypothetical protein